MAETKHSRSSVAFPAEWEPHDACWLAWPRLAEEWLGDLEPPRRGVAELCRAIIDIDPGSGQPRGERVEMLVFDDATLESARAALGTTGIRYHRIPYGDIWLRDTGPLFVRTAGGFCAACFGFNGWGEKYLFADDPAVGGRAAEAAGVPVLRYPFILEGGALDTDGEGTVLTTRQCLLNDNRNPELSQADIEARLRESLGLTTVLWLDEGLKNDHTDGHVDTLARFVAPGRVLCMRAHEPGDPNRAALDAIARDLGSFRDAAGRALEVIEIPSPGRVFGASGELLPATYANFYIGNTTVAVPTYGTRHDSEAVATIASLFPGRRTIGIDARAILAGGGAFHCITQQQPRP